MNKCTLHVCTCTYWWINLLKRIKKNWGRPVCSSCSLHTHFILHTIFFFVQNKFTVFLVYSNGNVEETKRRRRYNKKWFSVFEQSTNALEKKTKNAWRVRLDSAGALYASFSTWSPIVLVPFFPLYYTDKIWLIP